MIENKPEIFFGEWVKTVIEVQRTSKSAIFFEVSFCE